jgi:hypothetical protein
MRQPIEARLRVELGRIFCYPETKLHQNKQGRTALDMREGDLPTRNDGAIIGRWRKL